jgi:hypothetical protein
MLNYQRALPVTFPEIHKGENYRHYGIIFRGLRYTFSRILEPAEKQ